MENKLAFVLRVDVDVVLTPLHYIYLSRRHAQNAHRPVLPLAQANGRGRGCIAPDSKDEVYALLGVTKEETIEGIQVDYRKPVEDVQVFAFHFGLPL
jgi:hypothetical protein